MIDHYPTSRKWSTGHWFQAACSWHSPTYDRQVGSLMWSPTPPQKTQGLEGGKPRWVDSFLISEVCPILSETFLGCWKLLLLDFYGSLLEVNDWQGHLSSLLTLGFRCCRSTSLAHRRCQLQICVVPTRASRRWGLWTMVKQSVENQNHQRALWMEHAWLEKRRAEKV